MAAENEYLIKCIDIDRENERLQRHQNIILEKRANRNNIRQQKCKDDDNPFSDETLLC